MDRISGEARRKEKGCLNWWKLVNVSSLPLRQVNLLIIISVDPQAEEEPLYESHAQTPRQYICKFITQS